MIEVDGPVHIESADRDTAREKILEAGGLTILRFPNEAVLTSPKNVVQRVVSVAAELRASRSGTVASE